MQLEKWKLMGLVGKGEMWSIHLPWKNKTISEYENLEVISHSEISAISQVSGLPLQYLYQQFYLKEN